jgi:hypothetical protein
MEPCARRCCCWFCLCGHDRRCWTSKNAPFYVECWNVFSWFFSFLIQVLHPILLSMLSHKKTKLPKSLLTTKERQKSEENNAIYIASSVWVNDHTWKVSLSPSLHLELQKRLLLCYCQDMLILTSCRTRWRKPFWSINLFQKYENSILVISFTPILN